MHGFPRHRRRVTHVYTNTSRSPHTCLSTHGIYTVRARFFVHMFEILSNFQLFRAVIRARIVPFSSTVQEKEEENTYVQ